MTNRAKSSRLLFTKFQLKYLIENNTIYIILGFVRYNSLDTNANQFFMGLSTLKVYIIATNQGLLVFRYNLFEGGTLDWHMMAIRTHKLQIINSINSINIRNTAVDDEGTSAG